MWMGIKNISLHAKHKKNHVTTWQLHARHVVTRGHVGNMTLCKQCGSGPTFYNDAEAG